MTARRLSQFLALSLAALTYWVMISRPGDVQGEFVGDIYIIIFLMVVVMFGLLFVAMRLATAGSSFYWQTELGTSQVARIGLMIGAALGLLLIAGGILDRFGFLEPVTATAVGLLVWTMVPAAFLQFGFVKWPVRLRFASKLTLFLVGGIGIAAAAAWSYAAVSIANIVPVLTPVGDWSVRLGSMVIAATAEEVVFRVLLLTALLDVVKSRFQAVFLSSVAFGLVHAPLALAQPFLRGDWPLLQHVAFFYAPELLMQVAMGVFLGVLWLRSGSITLIALTHAIFNLGATLNSGL